MKDTMELYNQFKPFFAPIVEGYNMFDSYQTKKHIKRIKLFHRQILEGTASKDKIEYEKENIQANQKDYYTLLDYTINDEEEEKSSIYTNVYKYIRDNQNTEKRLKTKYIKMAKDLHYSAIQLLAEIYIYKNYHTKYSLKYFMTKCEKEKKYEVNQLLQHNLLVESVMSNLGQSIFTNDTPFDKIISIFFKKKEEDLVPKKYNIELWKDKKAVILSDDPFGEEEPIVLIKDVLIKKSIPCETLTYQNIDFNDYSYIISIITSSNLDITNKFDFGNLTFNTKIIKVTIDKNINGDSILYLTEKEDLQKFKKQFSD